MLKISFGDMFVEEFWLASYRVLEPTLRFSRSFGLAHLGCLDTSLSWVQRPEGCLSMRYYAKFLHFHLEDT